MGRGDSGNKSWKDERATETVSLPSEFFQGYFLPHFIPLSLPILHFHLHSPQNDQEFAVTRSESLLTLITGSLLPPPRRETTVCVPRLLEPGQQPHRHSSGPNYTLHHFPTEAEMGTDHSPSIGSDLHGPFHLHAAPYLLETVFSFIWSVR